VLSLSAVVQTNEIASAISRMRRISTSGARVASVAAPRGTAARRGFRSPCAATPGRGERDAGLGGLRDQRRQRAAGRQRQPEMKAGTALAAGSHSFSHRRAMGVAHHGLVALQPACRASPPLWISRATLRP